MLTDVSEEYIASIFRAKIRESGTSVSRWLQTAVPGWGFFCPEDGGGTFLRNGGLH
jgi:hypothetical protein